MGTINSTASVREPDAPWFKNFAIPNTFIGGSFALWKYFEQKGTKESWIPSDVDVLSPLDNNSLSGLAYQSHSFQHALRIGGCNSVLTKIVLNPEYYNWPGFKERPSSVLISNINGSQNNVFGDETFSKAIVSVFSYECANENIFPRKIQQVIVDDAYIRDRRMDAGNDPSNLPSFADCVLEIMDTHVLMDSTGRFIIDTKEMPFVEKKHFRKMCKTRVEKYSKRGFKCN